MKLIYQYKVRTRLDELFKKLNIDNPSGKEFELMNESLKVECEKDKYSNSLN